MPISVQIEPHVFRDADFIGGHVALDFVNTVTGRDERPRDWLDSYARLLDWSRHVQILPESTLAELERLSSTGGPRSEAALERAKALREDLFVLFGALSRGEACEETPLDRLHEIWQAGAQSQRFVLDAEGFHINPPESSANLDIIAWQLAFLAVELLRSAPPGRLRLCDGCNCSWLFIDSSKAGRRRWCDMNTCGNHAKYSRHTIRTAKD